MDLGQILIKENWVEDANCADQEHYILDITPDIFTSWRKPDQEIALSICEGCSVREECLDFAIKTNQEIGIWGGTTEEERKKLIRQRSGRTQRRMIA